MPTLAPGETIAGCRLEAVAGRGSMGVVFRATQLGLNRPVALKALAPELAADAAFRERFRRESEIAASVEHPNVMPVYEAGELGDATLYLVTRWVEGADLAETLRAGPLAPTRAVALLAAIAHGLDAAHRHGLVHRDVKPANILVGAADDHPYLTDFGIARSTDAANVTRTGVFVGTIAYAAPERLQGDSGGPPADIYSLGCVLYEMLTGHHPFECATELETMHAHVHRPPPRAPGALGAVVEKAMAKDPAARFPSAAAMADAMDDALAGHAPGLPRRRRAPWVVAGSLALVAAIGLAVALLGGGGDRAASTKRVRVRSIAELGATPGAVAAVGDDTAVADPGHARVRVVHADGHPTTVISVGRGPVALAADSRGRLWVADAGSGDVRVIDPASRRTLRVIRVGSAPSAIAISRATAFVADRRADEVVPIDLRTLRAGAAIAVRGAQALAVDGDQHVWVGSASGDVTLLDGSRVAGRHYVGGGGAISVAPGDGAWIGTADGRLVHLDPSGAMSGRAAQLHGGPVLVAASAGTVWVTTSDDALLRAVSPSGSPRAVRVRARLGPAEQPGALACAANRCVVADPPTRRVVAATF